MTPREIVGLDKVRVLKGDFVASRSEDPDVRVALEFARRLEEITLGLSRRQVESDTGVSRETIRRLLDGRSWADGLTIARLERALDSDLWPRRSEI